MGKLQVEQQHARAQHSDSFMQQTSHDNHHRALSFPTQAQPIIRDHQVDSPPLLGSRSLLANLSPVGTQPVLHEATPSHNVDAVNLGAFSPKNNSSPSPALSGFTDMSADLQNEPLSLTPSDASSYYHRNLSASPAIYSHSNSAQINSFTPLVSAGTPNSLGFDTGINHFRPKPPAHSNFQNQGFLSHSSRQVFSQQQRSEKFLYHQHPQSPLSQTQNFSLDSANISGSQSRVPIYSVFSPLHSQQVYQIYVLCY
jgi:hypothetical protein